MSQGDGRAWSSFSLGGVRTSVSEYEIPLCLRETGVRGAPSIWVE